VIRERREIIEVLLDHLTLLYTLSQRLTGSPEVHWAIPYKPISRRRMWPRESASPS
jgi:hypothetical protein